MAIFTETLTLPDETEPAGNAYSIMGMVVSAMRKAYKITQDPCFGGSSQDEYQKKATSGDYSNLRKVSQEMLDLMNNY